MKATQAQKEIIAQNFHNVYLPMRLRLAGKSEQTIEVAQDGFKN